MCFFVYQWIPDSNGFYFLNMWGCSETWILLFLASIFPCQEPPLQRFGLDPVPYQPPAFGGTAPIIPETPEAPPALQALQAMRGTLRRPGPAARAPAPPAPAAPAPMPRPAVPPAPSGRVLRLTTQRLEKAEAPRARVEEQHKFWWLDRM